MKTFYLIDFENVHNDGIANIESMTKEECNKYKTGHFLVKWRYQISFSSSAKAVIGYASGFLPRPFVGSVW